MSFLDAVLGLLTTWSGLLLVVVMAADDASGQFSKLYRDNLKRMLSLLDEEMAPCEDFFQHACATPSEASDIFSEEFGQESVMPFLYNAEDRMHFFEDNRHLFGTRMGGVLRDLYNDCKQRQRGSDTLSQWQIMVSEIELFGKDDRLYRAWPLLHHQWEALHTPATLSWEELAAQLAAQGVVTVLNIFFARNTIYITPANQVVCPTLDDFVANMLSVMQERGRQAAEVIAHELWIFCRELLGEFPISSEVSAADVFNDTTAYFDNFFRNLNLSAAEVDAARKIPIDVKRISESLTLLHVNEPRVVVNYILWQVYEQLKYDDCYMLTEEFEEILHSEYWEWHVFDHQFRRDVAMATYLLHTTPFQQRRKDTLLGEHWERFMNVKPLRKDLNIERTIKNYANTVLDIEILNQIYDDIEYKPGEFYENLLALRRLRLRNSFYTDVVDAEDTNHPSYLFRHFLYFCILQLKQPLFHYYATQGLQLWDASNLLYNVDGFYTALDCLERQTLLHSEKRPLFAALDEGAVEQAFRFYTAFVEAHRDYQFWLEGESFAFAEDYILEFFNLNSLRIMFYAVAQQYCSRNDLVYGPLINRSFMNMPDFQQAFNCSMDAPMNPLVKCMIRHCH